MLKKLPILPVFLLLAGCSGFRQIASTNSSKPSNQTTSGQPREVKFLDNISSTPASNSQQPARNQPDDKDNTRQPITAVTRNESHSGAQSVKSKAEPASYRSTIAPAIEKVSPVQMKYAVLMNINVEQVQNLPLYQAIDEWYGTPYKYGGSTKRGIDCSAFVQSIVGAAFGVTLPRTASEQYKYVKLISTTQLKEGDLLFFNTTGGVSHVGIYLQNNKFIHASVANGVTVTDMFEPYYTRHLIGVGRIENGAAVYHPENIYKGPSSKKKKHSAKKKRAKKSSKKK